jgi:hypothetical protein
MSRLRKILDGIARPSRQEGTARFQALPIPGLHAHFIGWNAAGAPAVLVETEDRGVRAPLRLSALDVQFCIPCDVSMPGGEHEQRQLSVITCTSTDEALRDYFLHLMDALTQIIGQRPTLNAVAEAISHFAQILQQLAKPQRRSAIGLYAELMIILLSRNPILCVNAWRAAADDRFDFAAGRGRLEVKATSDRVRAHYFSYEQCAPHNDVDVVIASLFVEQSGGGQSLNELIDLIAQRLNEDLQAQVKLRTVIANSLGTALLPTLEMRFDESLAHSTLAFFPAQSIPAIRSSIPQAVSAVRFRSDLSGISPAGIDLLSRTYPALSDLLPN